MTHKSLSLLTAIAMIAGMSAAHADGIAVKIAGRSPSAIRSDVIEAAKTVCAESSTDDVLAVGPTDQDCVAATVNHTLHQIADSDAAAMYAELASR